ncbi:MAG: hypothetical protein KF893_14360 [Caldilineaceae bacterium]|nr:hypothetical protein [Caldilineaceae bacterium]
MTTPLILPENFNPSTFMIAKTTEYGTFHESRRAAHLAADLVANGAPEDLALAEKILEAVLRCQERDANDPHVGNFYWMAEDTTVEDLNAVEFVLEALIPMMRRHADRLPPPLAAQVLDAIRAGLAEIRRLDVHIAYTNITLLDILNTCLGGELLGDREIAERGYRKLQAWMEFTNRSGHPFEFNSPTYMSVNLRALKRLSDHVSDTDTRQRAQAMAAKLGLSVALHIHRGTGRWTAPHGRAYHPSVVCETPPEVEMLRRWIADGTVPSWIADVLDATEVPMQVVETVNQERGIVLTTYLADEYALGTTTSVYNPQADVCMVHYRRPGVERPGVLYTRYVLNDKWFGDSYHATDRTKTRNLPDEGSFFSVQRGNRALGIYAPTTFQQGTSAKANFIWLGRAHVDEIWIDEERVETLPADVPPGATVVIGSGEAYTAVRPLTVTRLSRETPIRLLEKEGDLVLEVYNYSGPDKRFWELRSPGFFFQGHPICAFYVETASRGDYADGRAFAQAIRAGRMDESLAPAFTDATGGERQYSASYRRDGQSIGLTVDVMGWKLLRRWDETGDLGFPMLDAPSARQSATGEVTVGDASLICAAQPAWLWASPQRGRWVAGYLGNHPTDLTLTTPQGSVHVKEMGIGTVLWDNGEVRVDAVGAPVVSREG